MKNSYPCDICGKDCFSKGGLQIHKQAHHPMTNLQKSVINKAQVVSPEKMKETIEEFGEPENMPDPFYDAKDPVEEDKKREPSKLLPIKTEIIPQDEASVLIAKAIENKVDVGTMERLLAMRQQLKAERAKEEYDRAMAEFQAECPIIERKKQGYNYKYAPIEVIAEQIKKPLSTHGFSYTFDTDEADNGVIVFCKVKHTAGHMETTKVRITKEVTTKMNASQQSGAAMTYGKRYALMNAFGIHVQDEDNDAEDIAANPQNASPTPLKSPQNANYGNDYKITYKQILFIKGLLDRKGFKLSQLFIKYDVHSMEELSGNQASTIIEKLKGLPDNPNSKLPQTEPEQLPIESGEITPEEMDQIDRAIDPASAPTEKSE